MLVLFLLSAFLALPGCGATPQQSARHIVDGIGVGLDITDQASAQAYTDRARAALAASHDLAEYHTAMAPMDALEQGLRTASDALAIADAVVELWNENGPIDFAHAIGCVVGALRGIETLLRDAGVAIPVELTSALDLVHGVTGDDCFSDAGMSVDAGVPDGGV